MEIYRNVITLIHRDPEVPGKSFESTIETSGFKPEIRLPLEQMEDAIKKIHADVANYKAEIIGHHIS